MSGVKSRLMKLHHKVDAALENIVNERIKNRALGRKGNGDQLIGGMQFGLTNVKHPLARLLYHFDWVLPFGAGPEDLDMTEKNGVSAAKQKDLCLFAIEHRDDGKI
ncbi:hypothetical protein FXO38_01086 [Capsicum annuum]|nr:hypothetical protein FXO37_35243 [Capsicum annuum]KAF3682856.1 hypothetical protein FXO38_01086 [Capsicum annuum]